MCDSCKSVTLTGAYVQENGIIRLGDGRYIGRLDGITYEEVALRETRSTAAPSTGYSLEEVEQAFRDWIDDGAPGTACLIINDRNGALAEFKARLQQKGE